MTYKQIHRDALATNSTKGLDKNRAIRSQKRVILNLKKCTRLIHQTHGYITIFYEPYEELLKLLDTPCKPLSIRRHGLDTYEQESDLLENITSALDLLVTSADLCQDFNLSMIPLLHVVHSQLQSCLDSVRPTLPLVEFPELSIAAPVPHPPKLTTRQQVLDWRQDRERRKKSGLTRVEWRLKRKGANHGA